MSEIKEIMELVGKFAATTHELCTLHTKAIVIMSERLDVIDEQIDLLFKIREKNA
jgi:hypothetical protein